MITHIPNGLACCGCVHALEKCNNLDFTRMRVIDVDKTDGTKIVKCSNHEPRVKK